MTAAAVHEANPAAELFVLERNDGLGKKVIISGGGRCNVTTGIQSVQTVLTKYPRGAKFLTKAMRVFPPTAVYEWFESHGVPLKTEEDLRVFPQSDNGKDIVGVFERMLDPKSVLLKTTVSGVAKVGEKFHITTKDSAEPLVVDKLVLTTGGQAYRATGSTGDGYAFAQSLGHTITKLVPSLNAFFTNETWPAELAGLSFEEARFTALRGKNPSFTGPMLFTHKGVSGPAVFALSSIIAFEEYGPENPLMITIDTVPGRSAEEMLKNMMATIAENATSSLSNVFAMGMPKKLAVVMCHEVGVDPNIQAARAAKKDVARCAAWLKAIPLAVVARGAGDEFVTAGGVDLKEVDPQTMESKVCPGLYFAGEILDIDGFTGGFNLQASWATGHLAGESASAE